MKKKVDVKELSRALNGFIQKNENKTFTRQELGEKIAELGFNDQIIRLIIPKVFPFEKLGTCRIYTTPKDPVYMGIIEGCYKTARKYSERYFSKVKENKSSTQKEKTPVTVDKFTEAKEVNDAIRLLLSKGYKILRPLGLDVKALLADHPELESKYMRYANI